MDRVELQSVEEAELTRVEGGLLPALFGAFAVGLMSVSIGSYIHDHMNGNTAMSGGEKAAIMGALKQGGII